MSAFGRKNGLGGGKPSFGVAKPMSGVADQILQGWRDKPVLNQLKAVNNFRQ